MDVLKIRKPKPITKNMAIKSDVLTNMNRIQSEIRIEEEEFDSHSDILKNLIKDAGKWIEPKSKVKITKKKVGSLR